MKLEIGHLLALGLQLAAASPTIPLDGKHGVLSHDPDSFSIGAPGNGSALLAVRSNGPGDTEMNDPDDQDHIMQDSPARSPSPAENPVLPELTDVAAHQLVQKGAKMYAWMSEPNTERLTQLLRQDHKLGHDDPLQSRFVNYPKDLVDAGWGQNTHRSDLQMSNFEEDVPLEKMVRGLGLSTSWSTVLNPQGDNVYITWHQSSSTFDGKEHGVPTGAFYTSVYNSKDGVIMFLSNYGPREMLPARADREYESCGAEFVESFIDEYEYPKLSHVSDVNALEYVNQCSECGHSPKSLSKLVMFASQSDVTVQVVDYLLKKRGLHPMQTPREAGRYQAPHWDHKITYQAGTDEFNLLLANPNGNLATFLLIQHRREFGLKRVSKIDVFDDDHYDTDPEEGYKGASMVYYLEDLDNKSKPVAEVGASGSGSGKKQSKPGGSGGKPSKIEKAKTGGGRQGLRSGSSRHGSSKL